MAGDAAGEELAAQAAGFLTAVRFGEQLGAFTAAALASAAAAVREAGGDPLELVYQPAAGAFRDVAQWLEQGCP
jgi:hypothetical protein